MSVNIQSAILSLSDEHGGSLSIIADNTRHVMRSENPMFGQAVEAYRNEDWDTVLRYMNPEKTVKQYLFEYENIKVENGAVLFGGSAVHSLCVDRILQFADSNFNPMPLVRFLSKLQKNPSRRSVEELYRFLERNNLTVTSNGNFLAYKALTSGFYSITAGNAQLLKGKDDGKGRIFNGVGEEIQVYRNYVDDDANRGCSVGLHAGTLEYAQTFGGSSGTLVIVEIDPADVVSVPHDCECQKLRTARYKVVDICTQRLELAVYDSRFSTENDDWDDDGIELRPLVDARRSDGEPLQTASAQQRNAAIGYCCLMFLCCLGAQLATRFDPDKLRNAVPFIMHSCDGQGCERIVMLQVSISL